VTARRSEGTARRLVLRRTEAIVKYAIEQQDKFQLTRRARMLCLFALENCGEVAESKRGSFLTKLLIAVFRGQTEAMARDWCRGRKKGKEGTEDPAIIVQPRWYLTVDSFFAATAAIGGALSDPTPQLLPAQEGSTDAHPWSQSIV
jgi:hypothetical protein